MKIYKAILLVFIPLLFLSSCVKQQYYKIMGETQGTTYHIIYKYSRMLKPQVDSILQEIDNSLSIYNPNSIVSKINRNEDVEVDEHFIKVFKKAEEISQATNGAFDITVGPLVNAYGFGPGNKINHLTQKQIDSMLQFVGYKKVHLKGKHLIKDDPRIKLDLNAIAQGYTVDVIAKYFDRLGITDYMVEVGGELITKGKNEYGEAWRIGIDKPIEGSTEATREVQLILGLKGTKKAIATSGNYRKFYIENGIKYTHTINPKTGKTVKSSLLSASILSNNCTDADGYATACMVLGLEKAIELVNSKPNLDAFFIYIDNQGKYKFYFTPGFRKYVIEE